MPILKKTKIVATIGPASDKKEIIKRFIAAGVNVARLNFSHGDHASHQEKVDILNELIEEGNNIAILLDTRGPEVRTGDFEGGMASFKAGELTRICMRKVLGTKDLFSVTYPNFYDDVKINDVIRIDDGRLSLTVKEKDEKKRELILRVENSHSVRDKRSIVTPFSRSSLPFVSPGDAEDIRFACRNNIDFIALSFTRCKEDVLQIKEILKEEGKEDTIIIAKIENYEGYKNAEDILSVAGGIMIARGDLGVEVNPEEVPIIQKELVNLANRMGKIVIVATHMLDSMQNNPTPTRAEVSDVANAVYEGCDAVMLSGESASGQFPVESVAMEARIAKRIEDILDYHKLAEEGFKHTKGDHNDGIAYSVASTVLLSNAKLIVCFSKTGSTARRISYYRPKCPVVSISPSKRVKRSLCLNWGVYGYYQKDFTTKEMSASQFAIKIAKKYGIKKGERIILTGGDGAGNTNFMKLVKVE